jgi:radical SAM protein with 4Fe4S-binding SPASM domain
MFQYARGLTLQWHITERCNLHCAHCYQEDSAKEELRFSDLLGVLNQFEELLDDLGRERALPSPPGHVTVTGGEPFVRHDFADLLEVLSAKHELFSFSILTNGTFIDEALARRLRDLNPHYVQVSIEGCRATNDRIRGPGTFDRSVAALSHLARAGVRTAVSFTAHQGNSHEFGAVARVGQDLGVDLVWADRLIPCGSGAAMRGQMLTPVNTREFFETMHLARAEAARSFCRTKIGMHRALQFLVGGGHPYRCSAGNTLIAVEPNGDVLPCRRMPIRVGNLLEDSLVDIYNGSDLFVSLRDQDRVAEGCERCSHARRCGGGLRCLAYAVSGSPFAADPGCWHAQLRIGDSEPGVQLAHRLDA